MMDTPYRVEYSRWHEGQREYALKRSSDDTVVYSTDLVFLHRIAEALNDQEQNVEGR